MEINNLQKELEINNNQSLEKEQANFLETNVGKAINTGIDIGIRALLPNFIEDQVINLKDNLLNYGLKDGIQKTVEDAINLGKSAIGIFTGNFENVSQMQNAVKNGGIIDGVSSVLNLAIDTANKAGVIDNNIAQVLKQGKNAILNNVESNINNSFEKQYQSLDDISKYIDNWKNKFEEKDFDSMEKEYTKIEKQLKNIVPLEKTINEARKIETLHNLIRNNGQNFDLTKEQMELAEKLK